MKTSTFLSLLTQNPGKELTFEYQAGTFVPENYHITEVKNVKIDSVDCGGNPHYEEQTIVQLWSDAKEVVERGMVVEKAAAIFDKVNGVKPLNPDAEFWVEYGNETMSTSHFKISNVKEQDGKLTVQLFIPATSCKPRDTWNLMKTATNKVVEGAGCCGPGMVC